jgi:hypothetical protein
MGPRRHCVSPFDNAAVKSRHAYPAPQSPLFPAPASPAALAPIFPAPACHTHNLYAPGVQESESWVFAGDCSVDSDASPSGFEGDAVVGREEERDNLRKLLEEQQVRLPTLRLALGHT